MDNSIIKLLTIFCIIVVLFYILQKNSMNKIEQFMEDVEEIGESIDDLEQDIKKSVEEYTNDYNMPIENLKVFLKAFDKSTIDEATLKWKDSSKAEDKHIVSANGDNVNRDFTFTKSPNFDGNAINLLNNPIKGPLSMSLGIKEGNDFSIFIYMKNNKIEVGETDIYTLFSNSKNNVGVKLQFYKINNDTLPTLRLMYSNENNYKMSIKNFTTNRPVVFETDNPILLTVVKSNENIKVYYNNIDKPIIDDKINTEPVIFSNKAATINNSGKLNSALYTFGIYNRVLPIEEVKDIYGYFKTKTAIDTLSLDGKCPFDEKTCNDCKISSWSNHVEVLKILGNEQCINSVKGFCQDKKDNESCKLINEMIIRANNQEETLDEDSVPQTQSVIDERQLFENNEITEVEYVDINEEVVNKVEQSGLNNYLNLDNLKKFSSNIKFNRTSDPEIDNETIDTTQATIDNKEKVEESGEGKSFLSFDKFKQIYNDIVDRFKSEEELNYDNDKKFPDQPPMLIKEGARRTVG